MLALFWVAFGERVVLATQLIRSLASLLLSLAVAQAQGVERWFGSPKLWPFLAARGFIGAASMTLYYEGIARMPLADAVGLSAPVYFQLADLASWGAARSSSEGAALLLYMIACHIILYMTS